MKKCEARAEAGRVWPTFGDSMNGKGQAIHWLPLLNWENFGPTAGTTAGTRCPFLVGIVPPLLALSLPKWYSFALKGWSIRGVVRAKTRVLDSSCAMQEAASVWQRGLHSHTPCRVSGPEAAEAQASVHICVHISLADVFMHTANYKVSQAGTLAHITGCRRQKQLALSQKSRGISCCGSCHSHMQKAGCHRSSRNPCCIYSSIINLQICILK